MLLYVPAGRTIDELLDALLPVLERDDVVADGGDSYWGDSVRRHQRLAERGLQFVDVGTSGGLEGALRGACFMVGGSPNGVRIIEPLLRRLAVDGGVVHAGAAGAGHFVKLLSFSEFTTYPSVRAELVEPARTLMRALRQAQCERIGQCRD